MSDETTIPGGDEDFLAAEYALGVLPADQHAAVGAQIRAHAGLRSEYRFWRGRFSALDARYAETPAPANVWAAIERRLFADARATQPRSWWDSLALWRGFTAAMTAVAVVAVGVNLATPRPDPSAFATQLVAALSAQGSNVQVVALYNAQSGQIRITPIAGSAVPGKDYELWAIEGDQPAKSLGVIPIDSRKDVTIKPEILAGFGNGTTLAITLEQPGGSPTGQAQGPIVAAGKATPI
jgi:anti-sigma-K factor RskA